MGKELLTFYCRKTKTWRDYELPKITWEFSSRGGKLIRLSCTSACLKHSVVLHICRFFSSMQVLRREVKSTVLKNTSVKWDWICMHTGRRFVPLKALI